MATVPGFDFIGSATSLSFYSPVSQVNDYDHVRTTLFCNDACTVSLLWSMDSVNTDLIETVTVTAGNTTTASHAVKAKWLRIWYQPNSQPVALRCTHLLFQEPASLAQLDNTGSGAQILKKSESKIRSVTSVDGSVTVSQLVDTVDLAVSALVTPVYLNNAGGAYSLVNDGVGPTLAAKGISVAGGLSVVDNTTYLEITQSLVTGPTGPAGAAGAAGPTGATGATGPSGVSATTFGDVYGYLRMTDNAFTGVTWASTSSYTQISPAGATWNNTLSSTVTNPSAGTLTYTGALQRNFIITAFYSDLENLPIAIIIAKNGSTQATTAHYFNGSIHCSAQAMLSLITNDAITIYAKNTASNFDRRVVGFNFLIKGTDFNASGYHEVGQYNMSTGSQVSGTFLVPFGTVVVATANITPDFATETFAINVTGSYTLNYNISMGSGTGNTYQFYLQANSVEVSTGILHSSPNTFSGTLPAVTLYNGDTVKIYIRATGTNRVLNSGDVSFVLSF